MQAEESGAAQRPGAGPRHVQAGDETYVISDARWTRIFPDAASRDELTPAPRQGSALLLIVAGGGAALAAAGALVWWLMLAQHPSAPTPRPAPAPVVAAPVAPTPAAPTPIAPAPTAPAIPPSPPQAQAPSAAPSVVPAARPHHRAAVARMDRDGATGAHEDRAASHDATPAAPPLDATPAAPPPDAKKGNPVSRFFGRLFGGHHASANATSSGGEKSDRGP